MIWFLIALFVFVILGSLIDLSCNGWNTSKQFFTDSWWGIIAVVCGVVSLFLFYASSKSYKDVKVNESFLPNPKRIKKKENSIMGSSSSNEVQEFDLSSITMESLVKKMAYEMTKPVPIFFKGWGNRRLLLDVERVRILGTYVESLQQTGSALMELNADAALSYEKIETLTKIKRNELKEKLKRSQLDLDFAAEEYKYKVESMNLENTERKARIRLINAQAQELEYESEGRRLRAIGEYRIMIAKSEKEKEIAHILTQGAEAYAKLPPVLQAYVMTQLGSDNSPNPSTDMEMHEQLKEFIVRKHQAETRKMEYEADNHKEQSETLKTKLERERKLYKNNGGI